MIWAPPGSRFTAASSWSTASNCLILVGQTLPSLVMGLIFFIVGLRVAQPSFEGDINRISPAFKAILDKYVRYVFDEALQAKTFNGHHINSSELRIFFEEYSKLFGVIYKYTCCYFHNFKGTVCLSAQGDYEGKNGFPEAKTVLEATSEANNRSSLDAGLSSYKAKMEALAGKDKAFVKESDLDKEHEDAEKAALQLFDERATMGSPSKIASFREKLQVPVSLRLLTCH